MKYIYGEYPKCVMETNYRLTYRECRLAEMLREPNLAYYQKEEYALSQEIPTILIGDWVDNGI